MYHLEIYGIAWSGARSCYQYTVSRDDADSLLAQHAEPEAFAGDFQQVLDWRLVSESSVYRGQGAIKQRIDTFKTLRGFRAGMSPRRFHKIINGF